jgi:hypothetical protein
VAEQQNLGGVGGVVAGEDGEPGELLLEDQVDERQCHACSTKISASGVTACESAGQPHRR